MISIVNPPEALEGGTVHFTPPENFEHHMMIALVRPMARFRGHMMGAGRSVQLGAGRKMIRGWENLDYPEWDGEVDPIPCDDESISQFASYFTLDHLSPQGVVHTLGEIQRCLRLGGIFTNVVPHYSSQLAHECLMHRSQFGIDTWRNIFSERQYEHFGKTKWKLEVGFNVIFGLTERNTVLVTQLHKVG